MNNYNKLKKVLEDARCKECLPLEICMKCCGTGSRLTIESLINLTYTIYDYINNNINMNQELFLHYYQLDMKIWMDVNEYLDSFLESRNVWIINNESL